MPSGMLDVGGLFDLHASPLSNPGALHIMLHGTRLQGVFAQFSHF